METKGPSILCSTKTAVEKRNLIARAFRIKANNISLAFPTIVDKIAHACEIDTIRKRKMINDATINNEKNKTMIFWLLGKSICSAKINYTNALCLLNSLNIHRFTERQGGLEWFKSWNFSLTLSGIDVHFEI